MVGPRLNTRALSTKEMPRVPRSMALESAPVWRLRWKPRSRLCRCRKTFLAMRRMELWATLPNTAFRSSLKREEQAREAPSARRREKEIEGRWSGARGGLERTTRAPRRARIRRRFSPEALTGATEIHKGRGGGAATTRVGPKMVHYQADQEVDREKRIECLHKRRRQDRLSCCANLSMQQPKPHTPL